MNQHRIPANNPTSAMAAGRIRMAPRSKDQSFGSAKLCNCAPFLRDAYLLAITGAAIGAPGPAWVLCELVSMFAALKLVGAGQGGEAT